MITGQMPSLADYLRANRDIPWGTLRPMDPKYQSTSPLMQALLSRFAPVWGKEKREKIPMAGPLVGQPAPAQPTIGAAYGSLSSDAMRALRGNAPTRQSDVRTPLGSGSIQPGLGSDALVRALSAPSNLGVSVGAAPAPVSVAPPGFGLGTRAPQPSVSLRKEQKTPVASPSISYVSPAASRYRRVV